MRNPTRGLIRNGDLYRRLSASQRAGIVAASASVPMSLVPLLRPRSALDQGLITGLSSAMSYALTTIEHDAVLMTSRAMLRLAGVRADVGSTARTTLAVDTVALGVSAVVQLALPRREDETTVRALVRTTARRVGAASVAGIIAGMLDAAPGRDRALGRAVRTLPATVAVGAGVSTGVQVLRVRRLRALGIDAAHGAGAPTARSLGVGALTAAGAVGLAAVERRIARRADLTIRRATGFAGHGAVPSHLASVAVISGLLYALGARYYHRVEAAASSPDVNLAAAPESHLVSGGPDSAVAWAPLTRPARRHLASVTPAARIAATMGSPAQEPIRLYIGLTSAPTVAERVDLALAEIERTKALDRSLVVLCSPTGTGYLNYSACAAWEYLTLGDCASLTLQYSLRPSILSLDRVDDGREQNSAMWSAVAELVAARPAGRRPRVVLFGESLGAHTSQDPFLHTGTRGLRLHHVERALWLGTPYASGWAHEVRDPTRGDVRPGEVLRVSDVDALERLEPERAAAARYVLLSHDDDGITLFSPELLVRSPSWLEEHRTAAVPAQTGWQTPITFLQAAVDTKNAGYAAPGTFAAGGHDYRADIARAVRFAFDLPCTDRELAAVEAALRREEQERVSSWS
ncbi:alpha/beta-hydrolase family protein [Actinotalea sp. K2]|uniref:alpha/beta-hydrolase family protein n=1 Tax=Actinotalea sp. K2 TaxID=2939438 RepID=UPI0020174995|nr:alpha/beta-hydrolase family protein [Actinotalea sp. K2]MCL3862353.1 alpha/beta-hydrolase family protein [Actinotalea sp. K2]